jgi:methylphosphotriester-DNA--protein-cysteine methyltransferase
MRKFIAGILAAAFIATFSIIAFADGNFVASKDSDKYHDASCSMAKKIKAENKVTYNYPEEAIRAGKTPCGVCKPAEHTKVVGSKGSDKYHLPGCSMVKKIKTENLQTFDSPEAAKKAGCTTPCGICKPPKAA